MGFIRAVKTGVSGTLTEEVHLGAQYNVKQLSVSGLGFIFCRICKRDLRELREILLVPFSNKVPSMLSFYIELCNL